MKKQMVFFWMVTVLFLSGQSYVQAGLTEEQNAQELDAVVQLFVKRGKMTFDERRAEWDQRSDELAPLLDFRAKIRAIWENGWDPNRAINDQGHTPLIALTIIASEMKDQMGEHIVPPLKDPMGIGLHPMRAALSELNANINVADNTGKTALHHAAQLDVEWLVKELVKSWGAHPMRVDNAGNTALTNAKEHSNVFNYLATIMFGDSYEALFKAIKNGDMLHLQEIVEQMRPYKGALNYCHPTHQTPLFAALSQGKIEATDILLEAGASARMPKDDETKQKTKGKTPLHYAAQYGYLDLIPAIIQAGGDANAFDNGGLTPLYNAGDPEVAATLIRHGANPNARTSDTNITLMHLVASRQENDESKGLLRVLIEGGANPDLTDHQGASARDILQSKEEFRAVLNETPKERRKHLKKNPVFQEMVREHERREAGGAAAGGLPPVDTGGVGRPKSGIPMIAKVGSGVAVATLLAVATLKARAFFRKRREAAKKAKKKAQQNVGLATQEGGGYVF